MSIITTIPEKCRRCYTCVRECPAKAIKVEHGQAAVIEERCISCGNCIKVCAKKAKQIQDDTGEVKAYLASGDPVFAMLAPSFPAAFAEFNPFKIITATRALGFREVWRVAFGAELVSREYARLFHEAKAMRKTVIASPCPAIVSFVEKYIPELIDSLAPIVSPMVATARAIKKRYGPRAKVVFIGPCTAKKNEARDENLLAAVDSALTFAELERMFADAGVSPSDVPESLMDGPRTYEGSAFPIPGGLVRTAGLNADILENDIISTEGKERVLGVLHELARNPREGILVDALFCEGCISGPVMRNDLGVFARKGVIIDFIHEMKRRADTPDVVEKTVGEFADLDMSRKFTAKNIELPQPTEGEIERVLRSMKKHSPDDQLNCGACGYTTCREKAIAVFQGLAEAEMCLPYLIDELELALKEIKKSHEDLASAQEKLVQSEKLASLGQLSAGVAHEINNPLGSILLYSHTMLKQIREDDPKNADLRMIASEATRCKNIVRGLLDFARQSRVSKTPANIGDIVRDAIAILAPTAKDAGVMLESNVGDIPQISADVAQIRQLLVNIAQNGIDASPRGSRVVIGASRGRFGDVVEITVADEGCGIPKENIPKIFTPFFTTKKMGKGTGLGLAIAYGVVKMHSGEITVDSEVGKGTTVSIRLPIGKP